MPIRSPFHERSESWPALLLDLLYTSTILRCGACQSALFAAPRGSLLQIAGSVLMEHLLVSVAVARCANDLSIYPTTSRDPMLCLLKCRAALCSSRWTAETIELRRHK